MKWHLLYNFLFWVTAILCSCNDSTSANSGSNNNPPADAALSALIKSGRDQLQDGDLVMRSDNDFESLTLQNFSDSDRTYSHAGIAFKEEGQFMVYHSMTGSENPSGLVRKDPFDSFVSPARKTGFGIFRYQLSDTEKEKFQSVLKENISNRIPFDLTFSLRSDDSLYCSEMIYKALKISTGERIVLPNSTLKNFQPKIFGYKYKNVFLKKYDYISLDNLYLNPFCKEITRIIYQQ
jgi:Permuted papain-like amidase enzyme, YaeF/YiiX, C92 family